MPKGPGTLARMSQFSLLCFCVGTDVPYNLNRESALVGFGLLGNSFGNSITAVTTESSSIPRELFEVALGALGLVFLPALMKRSHMLRVLSTALSLNVSPGAIIGKVHDIHIHAYTTAALMVR